jgi:hypothetical protein
MVLHAAIITRIERLHIFGKRAHISWRRHAPQPWTRRHAHARSHALHPRKVIPLRALRPRLALLASLPAIKRIWIRAPQRQHPRLGVLNPQILPIQQRTQPLHPIALVNPLPPRLARKAHHMARQLVHAVLDALHPPIDNITPFLLRALNEILHEAPEARKIGRDTRDAHNRALRGRVPPRLVIAREHTEMAPSHKLLIVQPQDRVIAVQEIWVEDDLDAVAGVVEQLHAPDLVQDRVVGVVGHVVRHNRGQAVALERKDPSFEENPVFFREEVLRRRHKLLLAMEPRRVVKQPRADAVLDLGDRVPELLRDCLSLERLDGVGVGLCRHDDKGDDGGVGASLLELVVEPREGLDEHVDALVAVLVPAGREHIESIIEVEIVVPVKVPPDKLVDLGFARRMQILEFVDRLELDDVQTVREHTVRFSFQQMLALVRGDMRHRRKHICAVCRRALYAVPMVDTPFACLVIDVKVLQVVVKVDGAGAEVATEEGGVGGEDGGDIDVALPAEGNGKPRLPLVEVGDDGGIELAGNVLHSRRGRSNG